MSLRSLAFTAALCASALPLTAIAAEEKQAPVQDAITIEGSLTGMVQQAQRRDLDDPDAHRRRANYRGDVSVTVPGVGFGDNEGTIFVHARLGQKEGLVLRPTYTGSANSTSFSGNDPDDMQFALAQAWYQLDIPLGGADSARKASFTLGKIDPFMFFDQNSVADDETRHFVNNVFVHNPLLDSGGDLGADRFGFSPGAIAAYEDASDKAMAWGASVGVFGSGNGDNFSAATASRLSSPKRGWRRTSTHSPAPTAPTLGATPAPATLTTAKHATAALASPPTSASPTA